MLELEFYRKYKDRELKDIGYGNLDDLTVGMCAQIKSGKMLVEEIFIGKEKEVIEAVSCYGGLDILIFKLK